jgi:hypothetical protein
VIVVIAKFSEKNFRPISQVAGGVVPSTGSALLAASGGPALLAASGGPELQDIYIYIVRFPKLFFRFETLF